MFQSSILYVSNAIFSGLGLLLLKVALNEWNHNSLTIFQLVLQSSFIIGLTFYVLGFITWMCILSTTSVNVAFPTAISLYFIFVTLGSYWLFGELVDFIHILGIMLCLIGIVLINIEFSN